jgi:hypothetical protein
MASAYRSNNALCISMLDNAVNVACNAGLGNAIINIYTGATPATCEAAETGTLLGTCVMNSTPFGAAADANPGATITANSVTPCIAAVAAGTAGHFRVYSTDTGSNATKLDCVMQGSAGEAADTTDLTLDSKTIALGGTIQITSFVITLPES